MTAFLRSRLDDGETELDHYEPLVNEFKPGNNFDTSTPTTLARDFGVLSRPGVLTPPRAATLSAWLKNSQTGRTQIRAEAPTGWVVGDKTGHGDSYATSNDVAVLWPPGDRPPLTLAVMSRAAVRSASGDVAVVRAAARAVTTHLG